ncbi:MAG: hypothetical protein K9J79_06125 [Desulfobacteraceae bacterium]|nr:hypothetical protein [Desulfobacteraceae bacterium]
MNSNEKNISPNMTVLDVVSRYRQTEAVFKSYDDSAGECICCNALFESLADMAERYGLNLSRLIMDLEQAAREK